MRERRHQDWVTDLSARHALEASVADALQGHDRLSLLRRSTDSFDRLDYQVLGPGDRLVEIELKAKHQRLSAGWCALRSDVDERDLFVLDELALRKIVDAGRYALMLVRDLPSDRWLLWTAGDLTVVSRVRHARALVRTTSSTAVLKGKLLLDIREAAVQTRRLDAALDAAADSIEKLERRWADVAPWPKGIAT